MNGFKLFYGTRAYIDIEYEKEVHQGLEKQTDATQVISQQVSHTMQDCTLGNAVKDRESDKWGLFSDTDYKRLSGGIGDVTTL